MTKSQRNVGGLTVRSATAADCASCPAEAVGLFSGAFREQRKYLVEGFRIVQLAPQQTLYRYGDEADCVFLMRYGVIKLLRYSAAGGERIVRLARGGDAVGLEALTGISYQHEAMAVSKTALCRVPKQAVLEEGRADPRFLERVICEMQRQLNQAELFLSELSTGNAHAKVGRMLLYLADKEFGGTCSLPRREDIGALLGITMETASRTIADFRHRGLIRSIEATDRIALDEAALESIAANSPSHRYPI